MDGSAVGVKLDSPNARPYGSPLGCLNDSTSSEVNSELDGNSFSISSSSSCSVAGAESISKEEKGGAVITSFSDSMKKDSVTSELDEKMIQAANRPLSTNSTKRLSSFNDTISSRKKQCSYDEDEDEDEDDNIPMSTLVKRTLVKRRLCLDDVTSSSCKKQYSPMPSLLTISANENEALTLNCMTHPDSSSKQQSSSVHSPLSRASSCRQLGTRVNGATSKPFIKPRTQSPSLDRECSNPCRDVECSIHSSPKVASQATAASLDHLARNNRGGSLNTIIGKRPSKDMIPFKDMFVELSDVEIISSANEFKLKIINGEKGDKSKEAIANKGFGWVYVATMNYMIAFQEIENRIFDFAVAVASAMFIRVVDIKWKKGGFEEAKKNADIIYYNEHYKKLVEMFLMYQQYYQRQRVWPSWPFVLE